jgi:hypothetical protein
VAHGRQGRPRSLAGHGHARRAGTGRTFAQLSPIGESQSKPANDASYVVRDQGKLKITDALLPKGLAFVWVEKELIPKVHCVFFCAVNVARVRTRVVSCAMARASESEC